MTDPHRLAAIRASCATHLPLCPCWPCALLGELDAVVQERDRLLAGGTEMVARLSDIHDALTAAGVPDHEGVVQLGALTRIERLAAALAPATTEERGCHRAVTKVRRISLQRLADL